ncbi:transcriptional regulator, LuxR family [Anaeromyxobacter dehalogenans 2CP-1]|uniref:Transcriptional regulator, LuxR family n=1 Tax=Anaeromyxobacter dehalogenans (strain ATCC BAA-258 / DSM 21875 / 2CP-1) TaxID=455488 RepID=B8JG71_ANAD2|nr:LuxR family transcriptional regulator [Anaeromyxobacter dehalogenans]ACL66474.1 transcriptional regulator, LuxR family [Anaeromyxobacter dehalogenans 2CP-1]
MPSHGHLLRVEPRSLPRPALALVPPPAGAGVIRLGPDELVVFTTPGAAGGAAPCPAGPRFRGLRAVHACYAPAPSTEAWLRGVLDALVAMAPGGGGWFARLDGLAAGRGAAILAPGGAAARPDLAGAELLQEVGVECYRALSQPRPPVELLSRRLRALLPPAVERRALAALLRHGMADALVLSAGELDGVALTLGLRLEPGVRPPSRTVGLLRHVAGHLGTARRLRGGLAPEAACSRPARRSIAPAAVGALRQAGAVVREEPAAALRRWGELLRGEYALVDHWREDGAGHVLARRCDEPGDPAALHPVEGDVLRAVLDGLAAPQVGALRAVTRATVSLHLASARARLRCASRRELLALAAAFPEAMGAAPGAP